MASAENQLIAQLKNAGKMLLQPPSSIPELLNLLDGEEVLLSRVGQSPSQPMQEALLPSMKALIADELLRNSNEDVKINVAASLNQIMRISAPITPYGDQKMKEIFDLIVASFEKLSSLHGRCYSKAVLILDNVARLRSCIMMLDLDCDPLITKMFRLFLENIRSNHPHVVFMAMDTIMSVMIKESDVVSLELVKVLLGSIKKENQTVSPASWKLGAKVIEECSEKLKPRIMETVVSMGCSVKDFAPILCSICKVETDTLRSRDGDSARHPESSDPSAGGSCPAGHVKTLRAAECCSENAVAGTVGKSFAKGAETGNTSKRERKPNTRYFSEGYEVWFGKRKASVLSPRPHLKKTPASKGEGKAMVAVKDGTSNRRLEEGADHEHKQLGQATLLGNDHKRKGRLPTHNIAEGSANKSAKGPSREVESQQDDALESQKTEASLDDDVIETPYGIKNYKEDLVGCRIKVWWPVDCRHYEGTISSYDPSTKMHKVDYNDGDEEILNLQKESWEVIGDEFARDIIIL